MNKIIGMWLILCLALPVMASAAPMADPKNEIVYRTNLGRADDVKILLKQGVSVNQTDHDGTPLLALASGRKDDEGINVVVMLLDNGADINGVDQKGRTALFYAAKQGNTDIVKLLLGKGINYYAPDKDGNIARTIAFDAGHENIVVLLDDFVKSQTNKVNDQYKENDRIIQERYKALQEPPATAPVIEEQPLPKLPPLPESIKPESVQPLVAPPEPMPAPAPSPVVKTEPAPAPVAQVVVPNKPESTPPATPPEPAPVPPVAAKAEPAPAPAIEPLAPTAEDEAKAKAEKEQKEADTKQKIGEVRKLASQLSFHYCAYEYWYFCRSAKQSTELSNDELNLSIDSHADQVGELSDQISKNYKLKPDFLTNVGDSAKTRIFNDLAAMTSTRERHEKGVGRMDDMQTRCEEISRDWDAPAPAPLTKDKNSAPQPSGNGGNQKAVTPLPPLGKQATPMVINPAGN